MPKPSASAIRTGTQYYERDIERSRAERRTLEEQRFKALTEEKRQAALEARALEKEREKEAREAKSDLWHQQMLERQTRTEERALESAKQRAYDKLVADTEREILTQIPEEEGFARLIVDAANPNISAEDVEKIFDSTGQDKGVKIDRSRLNKGELKLLFPDKREVVYGKHVIDAAKNIEMRNKKEFNMLQKTALSKKGIALKTPEEAVALEAKGYSIMPIGKYAMALPPKTQKPFRIPITTEADLDINLILTLGKEYGALPKTADLTDYYNQNKHKLTEEGRVWIDSYRKHYSARPDLSTDEIIGLMAGVEPQKGIVARSDVPQKPEITARAQVPSQKKTEILPPPDIEGEIESEISETPPPKPEKPVVKNEFEIYKRKKK